MQKAMAGIQKKVDRTQKEIWAARAQRNQERFNDPRAGDRQMYKTLKKAPGKAFGIHHGRRRAADSGPGQKFARRPERLRERSTGACQAPMSS